MTYQAVNVLKTLLILSIIKKMTEVVSDNEEHIYTADKDEAEINNIELEVNGTAKDEICDNWKAFKNGKVKTLKDGT
jgi:hypothetical protein